MQQKKTKEEKNTNISTNFLTSGIFSSLFCFASHTLQVFSLRLTSFLHSHAFFPPLTHCSSRYLRLLKNRDFQRSRTRYTSTDRAEKVCRVHTPSPLAKRYFILRAVTQPSILEDEQPPRQEHLRMDKDAKAKCKKRAGSSETVLKTLDLDYLVKKEEKKKREKRCTIKTREE